MKKDQANRTQSMIYSGEAQISSLSSFHLHIICGSQSMSDMAHMWRTVIRVFMLLLSYFGGLAFRDAKDYLYSHVLSACAAQSDPDREKELRILKPASPPFTEISTLKITLPRSKPSSKTRQQYILTHSSSWCALKKLFLMLINDTYMLGQPCSDGEAIKYLPFNRSQDSRLESLFINSLILNSLSHTCGTWRKTSQLFAKIFCCHFTQQQSLKIYIRFLSKSFL